MPSLCINACLALTTPTPVNEVYEMAIEYQRIDTTNLEMTPWQ